MFVLLVLGVAVASVAGTAPCPALWDPTCGTDGIVYSNACVARQKSGGTQPCATTYQKKAMPARCPNNYDPVCGKDGRKYVNACTAEAITGEAKACATTYPVRREECRCPRVWKPVCAADGTIYASACFAECAGVDSFGSCAVEYGEK